VLEDGKPPIAAEAVAEPRVLVLSDRSRIELAAGARIVPLINSDSRFDLELERGRTRFEVTPGGPRAWTIDCGWVQVHVVGTAFVIERTADHVHVEVERGRVRVEGEAVPSGSRTLDRGESITVLAQVSSSESDVIEVAAPRVEPETVRAPRSSAPAERAWQTMAERGAHDEAYAAIDAEGGVLVTAETSSPRELMLLADVARLSGHPRDAVAPLECMLESHLDAPEAPLAAIILARLEFGPLNRPERAVRAFERAIEAGVPAAFDAEVCAGLAIARSRAGDERGAAVYARDCLARHASVPHAAELRALSLISE
jgi:transmembrane sensor